MRYRCTSQFSPELSTLLAWACLPYVKIEEEIRLNNVRKAKQRKTHREMSDSSVWQNQPGGIGCTMALHFLPYCLSHSLRPQVTFMFGEMCCSTVSTYVVLRLKEAAKHFGHPIPGWLNLNTINGGMHQYWKIVTWVTCTALIYSKRILID